MIRRAAYQSVIVVTNPLSFHKHNNDNNDSPQHHQPFSLPRSESPPQRIVHKVPIYLVKRCRSVLVKDLERIIGPGGRLETVQTEDGTVLLHRSQLEDEPMAASRPTVISVRDLEEGAEEEEGEKENLWYIHSIPSTLTTTDSTLTFPCVEVQVNNTASSIEATTPSCQSLPFLPPSSLLPSFPPSSSRTDSFVSSCPVSPFSQKEKIEPGVDLGQQQRDKEQEQAQTRTKKEPPATTTTLLMLTSSTTMTSTATTMSASQHSNPATLSEQERYHPIQSKVKHQTRPSLSFRAKNGSQSTNDPQTRSIGINNISTLQDEQKEQQHEGNDYSERGQDRGVDNYHHDDDDDCLFDHTAVGSHREQIDRGKRATDKKRSRTNENERPTSFLSSFPFPSFSSSPSSSSYSSSSPELFTAPSSPPLCPLFSSSSLPVMSSSPSSTSTTATINLLPTSPSTDTMLMRQQLLEMANALVSIADLSGDNNAIGEDKNDQETRMLALQVLESYKQALAGPTTDMNNNNTAATTPPPSSSSGGVHGLGMITPAATPQSTPVIAKSPRLLNTADTPAKTSSLSSSSTPTSTPRLSFVSVPNTSSSSTSSPSTFIQPFLSLLQPAADQDNNNKALFYNSPTGSSSIIGHDTHQMSISSLPPAPQHPPTIGSRKNSKDSTSSSGSSNGSKFSRMLRSNSVKNPFINMFGSIKGDTAETTGEGGNEHGSSLKGSVPKKNKNTLKSNRKGSTDSGNSSLSGNGGTVSDERINVSSSSSSFSSSSTPWYKIQQRRRDSRASSVSSISGSGSSTTNVPVSATAPMTRSAPIGREPGLRRFSASFSFHLKAASASIPSSPSPSTTIIPSRSETAISQISSHSRQHQYHQHDHQQQQHQRHHSQHTRHPQQQQQHQFIPPSYFQQSLHNRQQHSPPQQQRHLHLADTRMAGPKAITSTATGSFFDSVSDSDSDEDETTPHSMYRQQLQSPSQSQQLSSSRPLSYPATSASLMGPLTLSSSTSNSPRRIQIDPRTLQNQHQQHRQQHSQQEERSRYEVYDSDEDSDEDTDSEEEDSEDEAHDEEQHHRRQQQHQRQPYTPARVLVSPEPESLAGYIHRFDDAPPPSYHSLVRSGSVSSVATTTTTIMTMAAAQPALNQLLDLLHQFEEHVLSTFKTPAFRVADPSSPSPATFSAGHSRRESWQSRRPQTIRSFAYLLIELEQNGLLYPQRETLFLLTSTLPSSLSFCSSEQEWLAKTGGATLVPQLATAMLSLEQTCRDQAMMDPTRWLDVARSIDSNSNNLGPCTRDRWLVQVQSLSAAQ